MQEGRTRSAHDQDLQHKPPLQFEHGGEGTLDLSTRHGHSLLAKLPELDSVPHGRQHGCLGIHSFHPRVRQVRA